MFDNKYPYTDFHELNLDWFMGEFKKLVAEWEETKGEWNTLHDYVQNYFENLNVQTEIDNKINAMIADGTFADIVSPFVTAALPALVAGQLPDVVAAQISAVVAAQISAVVAAQLPAVAAAAAAAEVGDWLTAHIDPDTGYVIDKSLTVSDAAADAKIVGDNMTNDRKALYKAVSGLNIGIEGTGCNRVSTMLNGSGTSISESASLYFYKIYCKGYNNIVITFGDTVAAHVAHYVNKLDASGTVTYYGTRNVSTGSNKSMSIGIESSVEYVVVSFWSDNVSISYVLSNGGETKIDTINKLMQITGGNYNLPCYVTDTMYDSSGTEQSAFSSLTYYRYDNVNGCKSVEFTVHTTDSGNVTHWFNQFNSNDTLLSYTPFSIPEGTDKSTTVQLDPDCAYIKWSVWTSNGAFLATFNIEGTVSHISPYNYTYVSALGDSITAGYSQDGTVTNTFPKLIADSFDATYQNLGRSSTPVCPNSDYTGTQNDNAFVYRYTDINASADLIIIEGGTNDFRHNVPIGMATDDDTYYETTFYGACDYLLKNITADYPNARVVWVSPFHQMWDTTGNTSGLQLSQYLDAIKAKCRKYGITYIDAFACSGMSRSASCISNFMRDSIHPNSAGHLLIYKNIKPYFTI